MLVHERLPDGLVAWIRGKVALSGRKATKDSHTAPRAGQTLPLTFGTPPEPKDAVAEQIKAELQAIQPDELTPRQAMDELYRLRRMLEGK